MPLTPYPVIIQDVLGRNRSNPNLVDISIRGIGHHVFILEEGQSGVFAPEFLQLVRWLKDRVRKALVDVIAVLRRSVPYAGDIVFSHCAIKVVDLSPEVYHRCIEYKPGLPGVVLDRLDNWIITRSSRVQRASHISFT